MGYQKEDDLPHSGGGRGNHRPQPVDLLTFAVSRFFTNYAEAGEVFRDTESLLNAKFYLGGGIVINEKVYSAYSGGGRKGIPAAGPADFSEHPGIQLAEEPGAREGADGKGAG